MKNTIMMKTIEGLKDHVLGIEIVEKLSDNDYEKVLIPATKEIIEKYGKISLLVMMQKVPEVELSALWEDTKFGLQHRKEFERVAIVMNDPRIVMKTEVDVPFLDGEFKIFNFNQLHEAIRWVEGE